jgi:hypothetical protein
MDNGRVFSFRGGARLSDICHSGQAALSGEKMRSVASLGHFRLGAIGDQLQDPLFARTQTAETDL